MNAWRHLQYLIPVSYIVSKKIMKFNWWNSLEKFLRCTDRIIGPGWSVVLFPIPTSFRVPVVGTALPRNRIVEGIDEVVTGPGNDDIVIRSKKERDDDCGQTRTWIKWKGYEIYLMNLKLKLPLKNGQIFSIAPMGPNLVYWPMANSMKRRGIPHTKSMMKYGIKKAPVH